MRATDLLPVAEPDRQVLLDRRRREPGFVEQGAQLPVGGVEIGEAGRHVDVEHLEFVRDVPRTDPELEPSVGQEVDHRRFLGDMARVPDRRQRDRGADPGPALRAAMAAASTSGWVR